MATFREANRSPNQTELSLEQNVDVTQASMGEGQRHTSCTKMCGEIACVAGRQLGSGNGSIDHTISRNVWCGKDVGAVRIIIVFR